MMKQFAYAGLVCLVLCACSKTKTAAVDQKPTATVSKIAYLIAELEKPDSDQVLVIAHRGDWRNAPENSIQAIEYAIAMGVDMVEIDVRMTRDSVLVLMHDRTLDRTTNGTGPIDQISYAELQRLFLKNGLLQNTPHKVPTLEEALVASKDKILINLDTKDYANLGMYYEMLKRTGTLDQVLIKAPMRKAEVHTILGQFLEELYFMPLVRTYQTGAKEMVEEYQEHDAPVAFEFTIPSDTISLIAQFEEIRNNGSRVWVNSLRPHHCGGHDDEQAALDVKTYDWFIENHVNMIQTDRPGLLLSYLRERNLHD